MPHGEILEEVPNLGVGFLEEFQVEAKDSVKQQEEDEHHAIAEALLPQPPEQEKEDRPFHHGFIQLRGVAGKRPAVREDHGPGNGSRQPEEFPVDEITEPAEPQSDGSGHGHTVDHGQEREPTTAAEPPGAQGRPQETAVKRHPAVPGGDNLQGIGKIEHVLTIVVEYDISQASTGNEPEGKIEDQVLRRVPDQTQLTGAFLPLDEEIGRQEPHDVHETIPADAQRADGNEFGVDVGIRNHQALPPEVGKLTQRPTRVNGIESRKREVKACRMITATKPSRREELAKSSRLGTNSRKWSNTGSITMKSMRGLTGTGRIERVRWGSRKQAKSWTNWLTRRYWPTVPWHASCGC